MRDQLAASFNQWAKNYVELDSWEWCGIDGKSLKGTVCDYKSEYQNFVSVVSVFAGKRGLVLGMDKLDNKQASEITTVQNLITALDIKGVVLSLDALHCQKKFEALTSLTSQWIGLKSLIKVERIGTRAGKPYHQIAYYISSLVSSAANLAQGIRGHWGKRESSALGQGYGI